MFAKPAEAAMGAETLGSGCSSGALRRRRATTALPPAFSIFATALLEKRVGGDGELLGELAFAEDLDAVELAADEALRRAQRPSRPSAPASKRSSSPTLTATISIGERVAEAALREAALHRRLPALEVQLVDVALGARLLALLAAPGRLAEARADAAADAPLLW